MGYEVREPQNQDVKNTPADEVIEDNTEDPLTAYIHRRLYQYNKNWLAIICGETGSGKSYSALKIAETATRPFPPSVWYFQRRNSSGCWVKS